MTSFILNVNWDAELKLDKYDANLSVQFLNVIVDKQGGTEAEDAGDNRLEAEPEADLQGRQFKGAFGWNQEH